MIVDRSLHCWETLIYGLPVRRKLYRFARKLLAIRGRKRGGREEIWGGEGGGFENPVFRLLTTKSPPWQWSRPRIITWTRLKFWWVHVTSNYLGIGSLIFFFFWRRVQGCPKNFFKLFRFLNSMFFFFSKVFLVLTVWNF